MNPVINFEFTWVVPFLGFLTFQVFQQAQSTQIYTATTLCYLETLAFDSKRHSLVCIELEVRCN
jgi:hypothetical protein